MTEKEIKELFANIKWGDKFCCIKCGFNEYTKGNKYPDRRCKKCKANESLYLNTALEGLRFSAEKMYKILESIYNTVQISYDAEIILVEGAYISIEQFKRDYAHRFPGKAGRRTVYNIIDNARMNQQLTLTEVAKKVGIEQNTLSLRLRRIAERIPPMFQSLYYYDTIKAFLLMESFSGSGQFYMFTFNELLKIVLYPTKGVWKEGKLYFKNDTYEFEDEPGVSLIKDEIGVDPLIPYASNRWKNIFIRETEAK